MRTQAQRIRDLEYCLSTALRTLSSVYAIADREWCYDGSTPQDQETMRKAQRLIEDTKDRI